jgi:hypothetical protein
VLSLHLDRLELVMVVVVLSVVHKEVHQWAGQQQKKRQHTEKMGAMFREHEKDGNRPKTEQRDGTA